MIFFLKDIKRFLFFSSHQPMQRYAGKGRDTRPKWPLEVAPGKGPIFFRIFKNQSKIYKGIRSFLRKI